MPKKLFLSIVVLSLVSFSLQLTCADKSIFSENVKIPPENSTKDITYAYNGPASCATLPPTKNSTYGMCCYIKVKFENTLNEEKYTHKGCYEVPIEYLSDNDNYDIDDLIDQLKGYFKGNNTYNDAGYALEEKSFDIDCSSKYLQLFGLAFLILLL